MTDLQKYLQKAGINILPDSRGWINRFLIKGKYILAQRSTLSEWGCSCKGWLFHRKCYHTERIVPLIKAIEEELEKKKFKKKLVCKK